MQVEAARSLETCSAQAREGGGSSSSATANSNVLATIVGGAAGRRRAIASPGLWMGAAEASQVRGGGSRLLQPSPSGGSLRPVSSNLPQHGRRMGREGRCANARPSSRPPDSPAPWPLSQPARCTSDVRRSQPRATSRRAPREPERAAAAAAASRRTATCSRRSAAALRAGGARSRRQGRRGLVAPSCVRAEAATLPGAYSDRTVGADRRGGRLLGCPHPSVRF